jgi:hypothetical protein
MSQTTKRNQSVNKILKEIGMIEHDFISEIRHALTHKKMPSSFLIYKSLKYIILFLYRSYWHIQFKKVLNTSLINSQRVNSFTKIITGENKIFYDFSSKTETNLQ